MPIIWFIKKAFWCLFKAFLDFAYSIQICSVQKVGYWVVELWRYLLNYRVFHSGVDYFEVKYLANPLPDLFQILHGEPGDMYN